MKKLFTLLTLLVALVTSAWADDPITIGLTNTLTTTSKEATTETLTGSGSDLTLSKVYATGTSSATSAYTNGDKAINYASNTSYYSTHCYKWNVSKSDYDGDYVGYEVTVASGKTFSISKIEAELAGSANFIYKIVVENSVGTALYSTTNKTINRTSDVALTVNNITDVNVQDLSGTFYVKMYMYFAGTGKYLCPVKINVTGTVGTGTKANVELSFASASGSLDITTASPALPALSSDPNVVAITDNITYSSSNSAVATVAANGALTLVGIGTTIITANFAGNSDYKAASASYTLTVTDATKLGYTEVLNPDDKTLAARWLFGMEHAAVTLNFANYYGTPAGAIEDNSAVATLYLNGTADANKYTNSRSWKKMQNGYIVDGKEQWVGYDIAIDDNYVLNLTHLDARILVADDTYKWYVEILDKNGTQVYKSAEQTTTKASTANLSTDINVTNLTGDVRVKMWVTQGGSTKYFSIEKLILTGTTIADTRPEHTITFAAGAGSGTAPANVTVRDGETFFFPAAPLLYKTGSTLTAWNDGTSNHNIGTSVEVTSDMNLTAQFTANTVVLSDAASTVEWTFKTANGAPTIAIEGGGSTPVVYSSRATVGTTPFDALMTIDATSGKFNNTSNATYAQVTANTKFTIPAVNGMVVTLSCNQTPGAVTDASFDGNDAASIAGKTLTYTYSGSKTEIDIVVSNGGLYPDGISVSYPYVKTKYDAPIITVDSKFNFEHKGYHVTIINNEATGNIFMSENGTDWFPVASYDAYEDETTTFYAYVQGDAYSNSETVSATVTCNYDKAKKYVAWVYESNYTNAPNNYAIGSDAIHTALGTVYNVVDVDIKDYNSAITDEQKTALNGNLDDADLVVISEAAAGGSKALIGLKDIVGTVPMLNMKLFAYTYNGDASKNRWGWGTPKNADKAVVAITPSSKIYKVLEGVTFNGEDIELFAYPNEQNHIQYVDSWQAEPAGDVVLATTSSKPAMHASTSQKYFALGLSCDDYTKYNANAVAIVKNAAAMLIAGEALNAEVSSVSVTIAASGYSSLASAYGLDFANATPAGLEAYVASAVTASGVTLSAVDEAPGSTGIILKGEPGETYTIPVKADAAAVGTNYLHAAVAAYNCAANEVYILKGGKFCKVTAASTVPAGKAYLLASDVPASAPELEFNFGGTTGIKSVDSGQLTVDSSEVYNLAGQRVAQPTKGLYIVNGRKVVIK